MRNATRFGVARSSTEQWNDWAWPALAGSPMDAFRWRGQAAQAAPGGGDAARGFGGSGPTRAPFVGSGFPAAFSLADLDGENGFRLVGIDVDDFSGGSVSSAGDVNGDGFDDVIVGASIADADGLDSAGESYVIFGKAGGFAADLDLAALDGSNGFRIDGTKERDLAGLAVSSAGDLNGDGFDDLLIGAASPSRYVARSGDAYVVFGGEDGFPASVDLADLDGTNGFRMDGNVRRDSTGGSVSSAGDVNGDGIDDIIVGAGRADPQAMYNAGRSFIVFGRTDGFARRLDLMDLDGTDGIRIDGVNPRDQSGTSVSSAGDVNGDGFDDVIIGAYGYDMSAGAAFVVFGRPSGGSFRIDLAGLDGANGFRMDAVGPRNHAGFSVSSAGDVNGDGLDDVVIGANWAAPGERGFAGESYVVFGRASGFSASMDLAALDGTDGFSLEGVDVHDLSGASVAGAGDVNGDGFDDLLIGAKGADDYAGASYVVFGRASGFSASISLAALDGADGFRLDGVDGGDASGDSVSSAGDVNADGFDDIVIGAFAADPNGVSKAGESYVIFGRAPDEAVRRVGSVADQTIRGGAFEDVLRGKQGDDLLVGSGGGDRLHGGSGADELLGGAGTDRLKGGSGADVFVLDSTRARDADAILDFTTGVDRVALDGGVFDLPAGPLAAGRFVAGTVAADADDRVIYDAATGRLFFDADGTGSRGQILLATLDNAPALTAADIRVTDSGGSAPDALGSAPQPGDHAGDLADAWAAPVRPGLADALGAGPVHSGLLAWHELTVLA